MNKELPDQKDSLIPPVPHYKRWPWIFLGICTFACGGLIGSVITKTVMMPRNPPDLEERTRHIVSRMHDDLNLSEEQTKQIYSITEKNILALENALRKNFDDMNSEIRAILNDQQIIKFDAWINKRLERFPCPPDKNRWHERFPGPPRKNGHYEECPGPRGGSGRPENFLTPPEENMKQNGK